MATLIIISIIAYVIIKALRHLFNDSTNTTNTNTGKHINPDTIRANVREIASRYHASRVTCGSTFVGDDGCIYLNCSVEVEDSKALDVANDLDDEFGDNIDKMDITFNNNTMNNNQQHPQIIIINENNGTINGDYHNHYGDRKSSKPSDNAQEAEYEDVTDDDPFPTKGGAEDEISVKTKPAVKDICAKLKTKEAVALWKRLQDKGWVDENYRPVGLVGWQEVLLADAIAKHVGIRNKWQVFERFWGLNFMKQTFQKAVSNPDAPKFYQKLSRVGL